MNSNWWFSQIFTVRSQINSVISVYGRRGRDILTLVWSGLGCLYMACWSGDLGKDGQFCANCFHWTIVHLLMWQIHRGFKCPFQTLVLTEVFTHSDLSFQGSNFLPSRPHISMYVLIIVIILNNNFLVTFLI